MRMDAYITPANDTDYSCHIKAIELIYPIIGVYITPLVINSLGGGHTNTHTHTHTHTQAYRHSRTEAILRNQASGLKTKTYQLSVI